MFTSGEALAEAEAGDGLTGLPDMPDGLGEHGQSSPLGGLGVGGTAESRQSFVSEHGSPFFVIS